MSLYDFIYVDRPKVISLYSQLTGGVVEMRESSAERGHTADNKRNYDFKIFKHDAGGVTQGKSAEKEVIKPHHSLVLELERELAEQGYLLDLTLNDEPTSLRDPELRDRIKAVMCVKIRGRAVLEDYERMKAIASIFPAVAEMINKSAESNAKQVPEYLEAEQALIVKEKEASLIKNPSARNARQKELKEVRVSLEQLARSTGIGVIDQWILDGFQTWINAFLPGICNLRLYLDGAPTDEHAFGHLKKDYLEDSDSNSLHFTYGSMPTEKLTVLGIVTSVPTEGHDEFEPLAEFDKPELKDYETIEKAFRAMFRGFDGIEK